MMIFKRKTDKPELINSAPVGNIMDTFRTADGPQLTFYVFHETLRSACTVLS